MFAAAYGLCRCSPPSRNSLIRAATPVSLALSSEKLGRRQAHKRQARSQQLKRALLSTPRLNPYVRSASTCRKRYGTRQTVRHRRDKRVRMSAGLPQRTQPPARMVARRPPDAGHRALRRLVPFVGNVLAEPNRASWSLLLIPSPTKRCATSWRAPRVISLEARKRCAVTRRPGSPSRRSGASSS
jgi:hypothetical protein